MYYKKYILSEDMGAFLQPDLVSALQGMPWNAFPRRGVAGRFSACLYVYPWTLLKAKQRLKYQLCFLLEKYGYIRIYIYIYTHLYITYLIYMNYMNLIFYSTLMYCPNKLTKCIQGPCPGPLPNEPRLFPARAMWKSTMPCARHWAGQGELSQDSRSFQVSKWYEFIIMIYIYIGYRCI